jgi:molybdopterin synthase sulfur carrier subunit
MMFRISGNLIRFASHQHEIQVDAATLAEAIEKLVQSNPELAPVLLDANRTVRKVHRLFLNGEQIEREKLGQAVTQRDEVTILTAIAGG